MTVVGFEPAEPLHAIDGLKYLRTDDHYHPGTDDEAVLDEQVYVETGDAYDRARELRERYLDREVAVHDTGQHSPEVVREHLRVEEPFLVDTSSGAAVQAVCQIDDAGELDASDTAVVLFADRGDKYADIPLWEDYRGGST